MVKHLEKHYAEGKGWLRAAGLVAGAMSMAAGEYVSVSSLANIEKADLEREKHELETDIEFERKELVGIYVIK